MIVKFYDQVEDEKLKFAVIAARAEGKWVFCKHKARTTLEMGIAGRDRRHRL